MSDSPTAACRCNPLHGLVAAIAETELAPCPIHQFDDVEATPALAIQADTDPLTASLIRLASGSHTDTLYGAPFDEPPSNPGVPETTGQVDGITQSAADMVGGRIDNGHGDLPPAA